MGKSNTRIKRWFSDTGRMCSLINGSLFGGKPVFKKEHLKRADSAQGVVVQTKAGEEFNVEKYRDIMMVSDDGTKIVLLACENQEEIHYGMPVRSMLYDAVTYAEQIQELKKKHREKGNLHHSAEFLSGMKKTDRIYPVITVVFYYGEKPWNGSVDLHGLLGLEREHYKLLKEFVPNYKINLIDPAELEDLSCYEQNLQMTFGMLKYRKDKEGLKRYLKEHEAYFSDIDEETYQAARTMMGFEQHLKEEIYTEKENGGVNMCQAVEEWYQESVSIGMERGLEQGLQEGLQQGIEQGTAILIESCKELGISYEDTLRKVCEKFHLEEPEAKKVMERCWHS